MGTTVLAGPNNSGKTTVTMLLKNIEPSSTVIVDQSKIAAFIEKIIDKFKDIGFGVLYTVLELLERWNMS